MNQTINSSLSPLIEDLRLYRTLTRRARLGHSVERLAAYLVKTNPNFDMSKLVERGYISSFPYSPQLLWRIREAWHLIPVKQDEERFRLILAQLHKEGLDA